MINEGNSLNSKEIYKCNICNFQTYHLGHWQRHLRTKKHLLQEKIFNDKAEQQSIFMCECGKKYKYHQGLYRHKKICKYSCAENKKFIKSDTKDDNLLFVNTLNQMNNTLKEVIKNTTTTNNIQNNTNIILFLNDKCSNAISIQEFIEKLSLTANDLKRLKTDKPDAIADIVKQNLEPLSISDRPIHNISTEDWFVKDKIEGWQEDSGEKIVKNVQNGIIKNWPKLYEEINPDWIKNQKSQNEYIQLTNLTTSNIDTKMQKQVIKKLKPPTML